MKPMVHCADAHVTSNIKAISVIDASVLWSCQSGFGSEPLRY